MPPKYGVSSGPKIVACQWVKSEPVGPAEQLDTGFACKSASSFCNRLINRFDIIQLDNYNSVYMFQFFLQLFIMENLFNLKKLYSSNLIGGAKLQSPPDGYCLIVYQDLTPNELADSGVGNFYIGVSLESPHQAEMFGSSRRVTSLFESGNYPGYLFMMVTDYKSSGLSKSSLYYRWKPHDLPRLERITNPSTVFNSGIAGCLTMGSGKAELVGSISSPALITSGCRYKVGESVQITNKTLRFINPFRDLHVRYKVGRISKIIGLNAYGECGYNILFDDNSEAVEVLEKQIEKYYDSGKFNLSDSLSSVIDVLQSPVSSLLLSDKSTLANLALLSNLNQTVGKSKSKLADAQLVSSLFIPDNTQDVGDNPRLQEEVTKFYLDKTIKWFDKNPEFAKVKKQAKFIKGKKGSGYIYKILKSFIKKNRVNWYDLRSDDHYEDVKDYIREKLALL